MSQLLDDDDLRPHRGERELTLSTGAILGIFLGLVLLCGLFFAFGYNVGHRANIPPSESAGDAAYDSGPSSSAAFNGSKPSAGSLANNPTVNPAPAPAAATGDIVGAPAQRPAPVTAEAIEPKASTPAPTPVEPPPARVEAPVPQTTGSFSSGNFVVQVSAVSHPEDATVLVTDLRKRGYNVAARSESGDTLVHIQVGPFNNRHDADAMRQRLISDGFNAIIKQL
ncbi:MAG TPA: SPOR domain-containing protein [Acidobacteriaceae bacterium]|jgi:cell division septation protein DedD